MDFSYSLLLRKTTDVIDFIKYINKNQLFKNHEIFFNVLMRKSFFLKKTKELSSTDLELKKIKFNYNCHFTFLDDIAPEITSQLKEQYKDFIIYKYAIKPTFILDNMKKMEKDKMICLIDSYKWLDIKGFEIHNKELMSFIKVKKELKQDFKNISILENKEGNCYFNSSVLFLRNCIESKSFLSTIEMKMKYQLDQIELDFPYNILLSLYKDAFDVIPIPQGFGLR